jgi:hypothetical protein
MPLLLELSFLAASLTIDMALPTELGWLILRSVFSIRPAQSLEPANGIPHEQPLGTS